MRKVQPALPAPADDRKKKRKPAGKPFQKGVSGNPAGGPKHGESWSGMIKKIGDMTPTEAGVYLTDIKKKLDRLGDKLTLKEIVILRAYSTLAIEANASLMNVLMERSEGKTPNTLQLPGKGFTMTWEQFILGTVQVMSEEQGRQDADIIDGDVKE